MLFKFLLLIIPLVACDIGTDSNIIDIPAQIELIDYDDNDTKTDPVFVDPSVKNESLTSFENSNNAKEEEDSEDTYDTHRLTPPKPNEPFAADTLATTYGDIIFSSVIFHHGEFKPGHTYPKDSHKDSIATSKTTLTNEGKKQIYNLGKWIRTRYEKLIGLTYDNRLTRIDSQDGTLPLTSAETLLAGLFPPTGIEVWNPSLLWQPIPITMPTEINADCPYYDLLLHSLIESEECEKFYEQNEAFFNKMSEETGLWFSKDDLLLDLQTSMDVLDVLQYQKNKGLNLPSWASSVYPQPLTNISRLIIDYSSYSTEMQRLKAGPIIKEIVDDMFKTVSQKTLLKLHMYSLHGDDIGSVLITLGLYNKIRPPFGSALLIELRQKSGEYVITISYKNSTTSAPVLLNNEHCTPMCTLSKFIAFTKPVVPTSWIEECSVLEIEEYDDYEDETDGFSMFVCIAGMIAFIFLAFAIIVSVYRSCCKRKPTDTVFDFKKP